MTRVLLISTPHIYEGMSREPSDFQIGLGYLTSVLLEAGIDVDILDINANQYSEEQVSDKIRKIGKNDYDLVGVTAFATQYRYAKWILGELKKNLNSKIAIGGPLPTFSPKLILEHSDADIAVVSEGEITIKQLIDNLNNLHKVNGIWYKDRDGKIIQNPKQEYIKNLDDIPFPAWEKFPMDIYLKLPGFYDAYGVNSMNVISARGCPFNCNYCSRTFERVRMRSIDGVIEEIKELMRRYDVKAIQFVDELVMITKERMYELCSKISDLKLKWVCQGRVNYVDLDVLKAMKKAGCTRIGFGIESGSQKILNNMNKNQTVEMALNALKWAREAGLQPIVQMMYGYPGETLETVRETVDFCKKAHIHPGRAFNITTPLPGTKLWDDTLAAGLIKDEDIYLENLVGFHKLLVNYTSFSEEEFFRIKNDAEREVLDSYIRWRRKHPIIFLKEYIRKAERFYKYAKFYGIKRAVQVTLKGMRENPYLVYNAEYR